ncbi:hypothetical protein [Phenylobacterium sp.]|uniref:hypothetical protein n=1 Tax=Phenylobacterium sp. TaxID=1871053 RepID=UPI002F933965
MLKIVGDKRKRSDPPDQAVKPARRIAKRFRLGPCEDRHVSPEGLAAKLSDDILRGHLRRARHAPWAPVAGAINLADRKSPVAKGTDGRRWAWPCPKKEIAGSPSLAPGGVLRQQPAGFGPQLGGRGVRRHAEGKVTHWALTARIGV